MNKIFKVIWSVKLQRKVVASEYAKSSGGVSSVTVNDALPAQGFKLSALCKMLLLSGALIFSSNVSTAKVVYDKNHQVSFTTDANNINKSVVILGNNNLNNNVLADPSKLLIPGATAKDKYQYDYVTFLFRPEFVSTSEKDIAAQYAFLVTQAHADVNMILYHGKYNPDDPQYGAIVGNDDHESTLWEDLGLESGYDDSMKRYCAGDADVCPGLKTTVNNGDVYTVVISTYSPGTSGLTDHNTLFVGTLQDGAGPNGVIGEFSSYKQMVDILKGATWDSYDLDFKVNPNFRGGTLVLNKPAKLGEAANVFNYAQKFTLSHDATNTLDTNGKNGTFTGVWSDVSNQKGVLNIVNKGQAASDVTFTAQNTFSGGVTIGPNVNVILKNGVMVGDSSKQTNAQLGTGYIDVQKDGQYTIAKDTNTTFNNVLKGSGHVVIDLTDPALTFSVVKTSGHDFTGQVRLKSGTMDASKSNLSLVNKAGAALVMQDNGTLNLNKGSQSIAGNLQLQGGTINAGLGSQLSVNTLSVSNQPKLAVTLDAQSLGQSGNLVAQSNSAQPIDIIKATTVEKSSIGQALEVALYGSDGKAVTGNKITTILDNGYGTKDLTANYGLGDVKVNDRGINLAVGLESLNSGSNAKISAEGLTGAQAINALLTGKDFSFFGNSAGLTIAKANTYTGVTNIAAGKVISGAQQSFGKTSKLNIAAGPL